MDLRKKLILALTDSLTDHQNQTGTSNQFKHHEISMLVEFGTQIKEKFQKPKLSLFQPLNEMVKMVE